MRLNGANSLVSPAVSKFEKVLLYETSSFYYLIGSDELESYFRVVKLDRRVIKPDRLDLILQEDPIIYSKEDLAYLLRMINDGNKGGLVKVTQGCGIVGFVKFLNCYYLTIITQKKKVGCIGGDNSLYTIKATEVFAITPRDGEDSNALMKLWRKVNKKINQTSAEIAESRYMGLFNFVDVTKDFFFSYTYDLSHSLQHNYVVYHENTEGIELANKIKIPGEPQDMFVWNHHQTEELKKSLSEPSILNWVVPIIHGSIVQRRFSVLGKTLDMILIARRSRHYAGTRYLKRGVSVHGKVANDCEIEHIMQLDGGAQTQFCSQIQMRGSIPTYWSQETSVTQPKPPIVVSRIDPTYLATQVHFADMIKRYNLPIIVLDLVKQHERRPREVIVGKEYRQALDVVNSSMPLEHQVRYFALDYTRISKSKQKSNAEMSSVGGKVNANPNANATSSAVGKEWDLLEKALGETLTVNAASSESANASSQVDATGSARVIDSNSGAIVAAVGNNNVATNGKSAHPISKIDLFGELDDIATYSISETAFFSSQITYIDRVELLKEKHKELARQKGYLQQSGVLRTNCIDCLDRTNGGQFALGMKFLNTSLRVLGLNDNKPLDPSNKMLMELMEMYAEVGDRIAVQYGGSEAHNKMAAGKGQKSSSKKGELLTSIKRYYSNAFTDNVKQDAMNLFLGCFQPGDQTTPLWDLDSDHHLHNLTLNPPEPYINKVIFNEMLKDIKQFLVTSQSPNNNYAPGMNQGMSMTSPDTSEISNEVFNFDAKTTIMRYFIKSFDVRFAITAAGGNGGSGGDLAAVVATGTVNNVDSSVGNVVSNIAVRSNNAIRRKTLITISQEDLPLPIQTSIIRSEKRRFISKLMKRRMNDAVEYWWRRSVADYEEIMHRVYVIPKSPDIIPTRKYFDVTHRPFELSSFDEILRDSECFSPITYMDVSEDPFSPLETVAKTKRLGKVHLADDNEDDDNVFPSPMNPRQTTDLDDNFDTLLSESRRTKFFLQESAPGSSAGNGGGGRMPFNMHHNNLLPSSGSGFSTVPSGNIGSTHTLALLSAAIPLERSDSRLNNQITSAGVISDGDSHAAKGISQTAVHGAGQSTTEFTTIDSDWGEIISSSQYYDEALARSCMLSAASTGIGFGALPLGGVGDGIGYASDPSSLLALNTLGRGQIFSGSSSNLLATGMSFQPSRFGFTGGGSMNIQRSQSPNNMVVGDAEGGFHGLNGSSLAGGGIGQLSKYVREIGQKARFLVGGFLRKDDNLNTMGNKSNNSDLSGNGQRGWDGNNEFRFSKAFSQKTLNMYASYAECGANPMVLMQPFSEATSSSSVISSSASSSGSESHTAHSEFVAALRETMIDSDDVKAMEQLSGDSFISRVVSRGNFKGLSHLDDAQLTEHLISNFLVFVEGDLRSNQDSLSESKPLDADSASQTTVTNNTVADSRDVLSSSKFSSSPLKIPPATPATDGAIRTLRTSFMGGRGSERVFEMPKNTDRKLIELTEKMCISAGVESTILNSIHRYLFEQVSYEREINKDLLSRRMSSMTSSKNIIDYASQFHKEILAADLDTVSFIVEDPANSPLVHKDMEWFIELLQPYYIAQQERKEEYLKYQLSLVPAPVIALSRASSLESLNGRTSETLTPEGINGQGLLANAFYYGQDQIPPKNVTGHELILEVIAKGDNVDYLRQPPLGRAPSVIEYPGFTLIDPDVYIRQSNPFLIMNEIAVIMFSRIHASDKRK